MGNSSSQAVAPIISVVVGTRPEAIKLAPIILALRASQVFRCHVCATAQHRQMLDAILNTFGLVPDTDLNIMSNRQSLPRLTAKAELRLSSYFQEIKPNFVLVQGDTTTAFCAALAAFYHNIPVGHVEAGLRSGRLDSPWPEEANRSLISRLATLHFAPTRGARDNLLRENVVPENVFLCGNTVIDALLLVRERLLDSCPRIAGLPDALQPVAAAATPGPIRQARGKARSAVLEPRMVLITGHRRENLGDGLRNICKAIAILAERFPEVHFVYPVHLNPRVRQTVGRMLGQRSVKNPRTRHPNVHLIAPVEYESFVALMMRCELILTDSGGIQEEAPSLGKPVLVMRDTTERPEAVAANTARLVGTSVESIVANASELLTMPESYRKMARAHNPFGDGAATKRILQVLEKRLGLSPEQNVRHRS